MGGYRLGCPSVLAAVVVDMTEPRAIMATLCLGVEPEAQVACLARVRVIASQNTDVPASNEDVDDDWCRRRWQRRVPRREGAGYFDI
jgi:hypothetical protein